MELSRPSLAAIWLCIAATSRQSAVSMQLSCMQVGRTLTSATDFWRKASPSTCVSGAFLYHEYPTHWLAFTRHFWSHGQGMGVVFSKWPHQAPPGLAQQGKRRLTAWWGGSPLFPLLLAFWQLLMCLGYSLLRLPQIVRLQWRRSGRSIDQGLVNAFLSAYVLIVGQFGASGGHVPMGAFAALPKGRANAAIGGARWLAHGENLTNRNPP